MLVGDLIKMVCTSGTKTGLIINIKRRHGADCNRHSRVATVMTTAGNLASWPLDSYYQIEVINGC